MSKVERSRTIYHAVSPYQTGQNHQTSCVFAPDNFRLGLIATQMPPIALRLLVILLARLRSDGSACLSATESVRILQTTPQFIRSGAKYLTDKQFVSRKAIGEYWINPAIARPITLTHG